MKFFQCAFFHVIPLDLGREPVTPDDPSVETSSQHSQEDIWAPFVSKSFCCYRGHTADILDICWSKVSHICWIELICVYEI